MNIQATQAVDGRRRAFGGRLRLGRIAAAALAGIAAAHCAGASAAETAPADQAAAAAGLDESLRQAEHLLAAGDRSRAVELLTPIVKSMEGSGGDPAARRRQIVADSLLGRAELQLGRDELAGPLLNHAAELASASAETAAIAAAYNNLGLYLAVTHDDDAAFTDYAKSLDAARDAKLSALSVRIEVNKADLLLRRGQARLAQQSLDRAAEILRPLPASIEKVQLASAAAARMLDVESDSPKEAHLDSARQLLAAAAADARNLDDLRGQASVQGESSQLEQRGKHGERALEEVRQAIFSAQAAQAPELLYQWVWQEGRLNAEQGRPDEALADYRRAIATLQPIRHDLLLELRASGRSYRDTVGPLFLDYSDLLLKHAAAVDDAAAQRSLIDAREAIEQLKIVELEDYFHDDCTARFQERQKSIDRVPAGTAVIYPIILPDRVELLLSSGGQIRRFSVAVPGRELSDEALRFRKLLVKRSTYQYLDSAQRLYGWLIQPLQASLRADGVDTLVIVPDGALLGIPFAALHDGQDFLIRSYAIGTVPGLHLIEPVGAAPARPRALVAGLSASVQGFPALPRVEDELRDVSQLYQGQLLDNQSFTESNVEHAEDQGSFNVVHIASHGKFESEASKSFLLTYDGKLGMDSLERLVRTGKTGEDALDLLTLSACETAAGDERAALGLAGVAIKAGARSVVATLWNINDEAASGLVRDFYRELHHGAGSKAKALQAAQLHLLNDPRYRHPGYWAPFLLIGNWT